MLTVPAGHPLCGEFVSEKNGRISQIVLGAGIVGALILLLSQGTVRDQVEKTFQIIKGSPSVTVPARALAAPNQFPASQKLVKKPPIKPQSEIHRLNERGVKLVLRKKYWEGVYSFEKAIKISPSNIIPIINMAVSLNAMGMNRPAEKYFKMAEAIDPEHPGLQANFRQKNAEKRDQRMKRAMEFEKLVVPENTDGMTDGVRLWKDGSLMLWGIDGSEIY